MEISISDDRALNKYFIKFEEFLQSVINKLLNSILNKVFFFKVFILIMQTLKNRNLAFNQYKDYTHM